VCMCVWTVCVCAVVDWCRLLCVSRSVGRTAPHSTFLHLVVPASRRSKLTPSFLPSSLSCLPARFSFSDSFSFSFSFSLSLSLSLCHTHTHCSDCAPPTYLLLTYLLSPYSIRPSPSALACRSSGGGFAFTPSKRPPTTQTHTHTHTHTRTRTHN